MDNENDYEDDLVDNPRPTKRFKVHLLPAYEQPQPFLLEEENENDELSSANGSTFYAALTHWRQLNLSPVFLRFAEKVDSLSASMPLFLLNWERIVQIWVDAMSEEDNEGEGARVLLDLMQKMLYDLRGTMDSKYETLLACVLGLVPTSKGKGKAKGDNRAASTSQPKLHTKAKTKPTQTHISPETLTTLLSTLSALFKFLLLSSLSSPSTEDTCPHPRLEQTWHQLHTALAQTTFPEVQRALTEVWGSVLRRMRGCDRKWGVVLVLAAVEDEQRQRGIGEACAWIVTFACKSVSQTLHTSSPSIFEAILDVYLSPSSQKQRSTQTLIRRTLTSLIHHSKTPAAFAPLADVLVGRFGRIMQQFTQNAETAADALTLQKIIDALAVPCSVRNGSRLMQSHLTQILSSIPALAQTPLEDAGVHKALVRLLGAVLAAGEMPVWGAGVRKVEGAWEAGACPCSEETESEKEKNAKSTLTFALNITAVLASLSPPSPSSNSTAGTGPFKGFKPLLLPLLLKYTTRPDVRRRDPRGVARVLAGVVRDGWVAKGKGAEKDGEKDTLWRTRVGEWCLERLSALIGELEGRGQVDAKTATHLTDILTLSSMISSSSPAKDVCGVIVDGIKGLFTALSSSPSKSKLQKRNLSPSWALAHLIHTLSARNHAEWNALVKEDVGEWINVCLESPGMEEVLGGVMGLVERLETHTPTHRPTPYIEHPHHAALLSLLLSPKHSTRLTALRLLSSTSSLLTPPPPPAVRAAAEACLKAEQVPIDVAGVRERVLRIGRVANSLGQEKEGETRAVELVATWLVSQLKVNLRPLWAPACKALGGVVERSPGWGDMVWGVVWGQVRGVEANRNEDGGQESEDEDEDEPKEEEEEDDPWEEERSWRDPSAHKLRSTVWRWVNGDAAAYDDLLKAQDPQARFDINTYETQLLAALTVFPSLAEKHNRDIVPWFLSLSPQSESQSPTQTTLVPALPKPCLIPYLTLFSKFTNPKALVHTTALQGVYTTLLSHPDRALRALALECVLTYRDPRVLACEETLRALVDEGRFRDALQGLNFGDEDVLSGAGSDDDNGVVRIVVRILYGSMLDRGAKGRSASGGGGDRRTAVLGALAGCEEKALALLVDLMLGPLGLAHESHLPTRTGENEEFEFDLAPISAHVSPRQRAGFLVLLGDVLRYLGPKTVRYWPALVGATVRIVGDAQRGVDAVNRERKAEQEEEQEEEGADADAEAEEKDEDEEEGDQLKQNDAHLPASSSGTSTKILRSIRQLGLKRLAEFFLSPASLPSPSKPQFDFTPYLRPSFSAFISPRLVSLPSENTHTPSALLELFAAWTTHECHAQYLVAYDEAVLGAVFGCLVQKGVGAKVIGRVFDVVERILSLCANENNDKVLWIREKVVKPHVGVLLADMAILFQRFSSYGKGSPTPNVILLSSPLSQRQIHILSEIAPYATDPQQAETLLRLIAPLLRRPVKVVPEKMKVDLVRVVGSLVGVVGVRAQGGGEKEQEGVFEVVYAVLSTLFQSLRTRQGRLALVDAFTNLTRLSPPESTSSLSEVAALLKALNAYSPKRIDEPDFDARLEAFGRLNERLYRSLGCKEWVPVVYNMFYAIQDTEELAVRNSAAYGLRRFVERVVEESSVGEPGEFGNTFGKIVFPGLKNGLRSKNEMVRAEVLGVIAFAVERSDSLPPTGTTTTTAAASTSGPASSAFTSLREMRILLEHNDPEANFFNNILHVQNHRRTRTLRRLREHCDAGHLRSSTINEIFVPLVGNYIDLKVDHLLVNEAIGTTGRLAGKLAWGAYYALVRKYLGGRGKGGERERGKEGDGEERVRVRTLVAVLDNFHFAMEEVVPEGEAAGEGAAEGEEGEDEADIDTTQEPPVVVKLTTQHPATTAKIADAVNLRLLPTLLSHLEKRDPETDDNTRIPLAIGIVTVAKHLPASTREPQITRLLTILSQILRSRSQETRDLTRESLNRIAVALGVTYVPLLLKELRAALLRGPQLHVLAYVVHSLLVHVTTGEHAGAFEVLDDCVNDIAYVSAEVVFGESGKDVQSEDFKTKMREVRSSAAKGLDAFGIVARFVSPEKISSLLAPIKAIMQETASLKVMNLVEEVLKRVAGGLNSNKHLVPKELLVLCNTLVSQNAKFLQQSMPLRTKRGAKGDAIVQVKRQEAVKVDHYANNSFRFVTFGLDLLNTAMRRNRFDFHDAEVMSRLNAMVVVVGNTLYSTSAPVLLLGLRSAAGLSKCPLKSLDKSLPVFVKQILDIVQQTGSTESEVVQVAFKSLATILRDGPPVQVKEKDLVYLLELLGPDLEDPERQASVFTMLRAIVARKFVVPEIYDLMDKVSEVMVTSQSTQVQELCRGVLLQFLLDYPQGKGRLRKQMTFLAKNLSYVYESGRKSVMELLGAVVTKFQENLIREYADLLFVALVMVIANDDSAKCREMAAVLIKSLFGRLDDERRKLILSHLHSWASQQAQPQLARVSSQVYGFVIDVLETESKPYIITILEDLNAALERSGQALAEAESQDAVEPAVDLDWQAPYYALTVLSKVLRVFPDFVTHPDRVQWDLVVPHLLFPHAWVRTASCRLLGVLFTAIAPAAPSAQYADSHPLSNHGMQEVAKKLCLQLKSEHLDDTLALQVVKNLFYIGKCFYAMASPEVQDDDEDEEDEKEAPDTELLKQQNPLPWLFSKLSYQVKSAHIARRNRTSNNTNWAQQPLAVLRWFAAMTSHMEAMHLEKFLVHVLTPLYRLLEEDTIRDSQMDELKTLATELQDLLQGKVGTTKFSTTYNQIRQSVLEVRRDRKTARATQAVANPEAAAKRKMQRNVIKKESRKRKDRGFAEKHGRAKRRRDEEAM
ncbi:hypothetical protein H0H92_014650 [Tricholoma furcatifolium]|nr:hypothetical protein H0H92_014650 [Tricholoma furcatifolium]